MEFGAYLLANGLNSLGIVERVPELADQEQILSLYETFLEGTGNTLASFDLIAIIC